MMKRSMIAACVLALSAGTAFAGDNWMTNWVPPGPNDAPGGANGAAPTHDVGVSSSESGSQSLPRMVMRFTRSTRP